MVTIDGGSRSSAGCRPARAVRAFTLIELLVVIAIIGLLMSILLPALTAARERARGTKCLAALRVFGQGLSIYATDNRDVLVPGRLPKIPGDNCETHAMFFGRRKYRPTFIAMMSSAVGAPPFADPQACKLDYDESGERGDRQDYSYPLYVCPSVPEWTDERNGSYGYNYQFLGNSRLFDDTIANSYKNWPMQLAEIRYPGRTVAIADCMGTAAHYATAERGPYDNNSRDPELLGNEGFNLDPPRVDPDNDGEVAGHTGTEQCRSAADPRHSGRANVMCVDGHAAPRTLQELGYHIAGAGNVSLGMEIGQEGDNTQWSGDGRDVPWTPTFRP
ncbi:MAG: type II secretion system GspH family protein [Planctomycetes bacterium]|nr:type II secretion system GspH family protein [Planctomycetota bacterium]